MTHKSAGRRAAVLVGAAALVLGAAGCTKSVGGTATAGPRLIVSTEGQVMQAPEESFVYESGVTLTLSEAIDVEDMDGTLSYEVGRTLPLHVANHSDVDLNMGEVSDNFTVDCNGSQWEFGSSDSHPLSGPETLPAGESDDYTFDFALRDEDRGVVCSIEFVIIADGEFLTPATFEMTID